MTTPTLDKMNAADIRAKTKDELAELAAVVGIDEEKDNELCCIGFNRIKGGKPFNINTNWFLEILKDIGQK